jgi:hypothetical protein
MLSDDGRVPAPLPDAVDRRDASFTPDALVPLWSRSVPMDERLAGKQRRHPGWQRKWAQTLRPGLQ